MTKDLVKRLQDKEERMIEIRRHLHEHPELSFKEEETPKYIADFTKIKIVRWKQMLARMV